MLHVLERVFILKKEESYLLFEMGTDQYHIIVLLLKWEIDFFFFLHEGVIPCLSTGGRTKHVLFLPIHTSNQTCFQIGLQPPLISACVYSSSSVLYYCSSCFQSSGYEVRFIVPKAKCDRNSFILLFLCNIFDVQMLLLWRDYFSGCIFHSLPTADSLTVGVDDSVAGWKLIYTVGKSSACAMIEILECLVSIAEGFKLLPGTSL